MRIYDVPDDYDSCFDSDDEYDLDEVSMQDIMIDHIDDLDPMPNSFFSTMPLIDEDARIAAVEVTTNEDITINP